MPNNYIVNGKRVSADAYNKMKYEDLRVRVPMGIKARIKAHADRMGESVNGFIGRAIENQIANDTASAPTATKQSTAVTDEKEECTP